MLANPISVVCNDISNDICQSFGGLAITRLVSKRFLGTMTDLVMRYRFW